MVKPREDLTVIKDYLDEKKYPQISEERIEELNEVFIKYREAKENREYKKVKEMKTEFDAAVDELTLGLICFAASTAYKQAHKYYGELESKGEGYVEAVQNAVEDLHRIIKLNYDPKKLKESGSKTTTYLTSFLVNEFKQEKNKTVVKKNPKDKEIETTFTYSMNKLKELGMSITDENIAKATQVFIDKKEDLKNKKERKNSIEIWDEVIENDILNAIPSKEAIDNTLKAYRSPKFMRESLSDPIEKDGEKDMKKEDIIEDVSAKEFSDKICDMEIFKEAYERAGLMASEKYCLSQDLGWDFIIEDLETMGYKNNSDPDKKIRSFALVKFKRALNEIIKECEEEDKRISETVNAEESEKLKIII